MNRVLSFCLLFYFFSSGFVFASEKISSEDQITAEDYIRFLIDKSRKLRLAESKSWIKLGHWRKSGNWRKPEDRKYKSEADGPLFFFAENGKRNPKAELEANIRAIFAPIKKKPQMHFICRMPARLMFLKEKLGIDVSRIPSQKCPELMHFLSTTNAKSASIVFSTYYMSTPASSFGHSFLKIERHLPLVKQGKRELLDHGIEFSADVDTENSVIYAVKGLVGLFKGTFKRIPYYYKVREYNDYESRDLWSYHLNLTQKQLLMLVLHLWELGSNYFDYYYMTENCSYHIFAAVDVVLEEHDLIAELSRSTVLPVDTLKIINNVPGLVSKTEFRPSLTSQFKLRAGLLEQKYWPHIKALSERPEQIEKYKDLDNKTKMLILDASLDLVDIRYAKDWVKEEKGRGAKIKQRLMEMRSKLLVPSPNLKLNNSAPPHKAHPPALVGLGHNYSNNYNDSLRLDYRMHIHGLLDSSKGFPPFSSIEFLKTSLDYERSTKKFRFDRLWVLKIQNFQPIDHFNNPISWKLKFGLESVKENALSKFYSITAQGGAGNAFELIQNRLYFAFIWDLQIRYAKELELRGSKIPFQFNSGPFALVKLKFAENLNFLTKASWMADLTDFSKSHWKLVSSARYFLSTSYAFDFSAEKSSANLDLFAGLKYYY